MEFCATQIQAAVMFTWQLDTQIQPGLWKERGWAGGAVIFSKVRGFFISSLQSMFVVMDVHGLSLQSR